MWCNVIYILWFFFFVFGNLLLLRLAEAQNALRWISLQLTEDGHECVFECIYVVRWYFVYLLRVGARSRSWIQSCALACKWMHINHSVVCHEQTERMNVRKIRIDSEEGSVSSSIHTHTHAHRSMFACCPNMYRFWTIYFVPVGRPFFCFDIPPWHEYDFSVNKSSWWHVRIRKPKWIESNSNGMAILWQTHKTMIWFQFNYARATFRVCYLPGTLHNE